MATKHGVLEDVSQTSRRHRGHFGRRNDRPHFYLDKNVLFDYADARVFDSSGQSGSVAIVERVIKGQVRASVSADAVKSTYNHLRHRLMRPAVEGGRDASEDAAELTARQFVQEVFCAGGAWRMICLDAGAFKQTLSEPCEGLSLEDALEYSAYQAARVGKAGPTMFVTRDTHFPEGVHPAFVARDFGWR